MPITKSQLFHLVSEFQKKDASEQEMLAIEHP